MVVALRRQAYTQGQTKTERAVKPWSQQGPQQARFLQV